METYVFIKFALLLVICHRYIVFTNATSSEEVRTLERKVKFMNSQLQTKLNDALFEIKEIKDRSVKCDCQQHASTGTNVMKYTYFLMNA